MSAAARLGVAVCGVVVVTAVVVACDLRPTLAQTAFFPGFRDELALQCCECLARRGTGSREATCSEAILVDGGVGAPDDAVVGDTDGSLDGNDEVDPGEIPCLCGGLDQQQCLDRVSNPDAGVLVPGACIDQLEATAPCENACLGVLSFEPVTAN
jgi:hypothetical protein